MYWRPSGAESKMAKRKDGHKDGQYPWPSFKYTSYYHLDTVQFKGGQLLGVYDECGPMVLAPLHSQAGGRAVCSPVAGLNARLCYGLLAQTSEFADMLESGT